MSSGAIHQPAVSVPSGARAAAYSPIGSRRTWVSREALLAFAVSAAKLLALFSAAAMLRFWIIMAGGVGHASDLNLFVRWTRGLTEHGLAGFYGAESFCDYPPLMLLVLRGLGEMIQFLTGGLAVPDVRLGIKFVSCMADFGIGSLLLIEGRRLLGIGGALLAAGLYLLNPVALYDSAYWGQVDAIYTLFLLGSLVLALRGRFAGAGALAAVSLAAKFQSIAILPLVLFEAYRRFGWTGLSRTAGGAAVAMVLLAIPFIQAGTVSETLTRAYVNTVGQYPERSKNAYNIWYVLGAPHESDASPPAAFVRLAAAGRDSVGANESWLLHLTWRRISLVLFALAVAVVLSLYALRPGPYAFFGAAGGLALCFFLFPTEMHERYAFPAVAMLPIWAASSMLRERVFWVLTLLLSLNLAAVLSAEPLAPQIGAAMLCLFAFLLFSVVAPRSVDNNASQEAVPGREGRAAEPPRPLIRAFQVATAGALVLVLGVGGFLAFEVGKGVGEPWVGPADTQIALGDLRAKRARQDYKDLAIDKSVDGGRLRIGDTFYLYGLGTHASARLSYDIPAGMQAFEAVAGIEYTMRGHGSAVVRVLLDGRCAYTSPMLTGYSEPLPIQVELAGARQLCIEVEPAGDGNKCDHVNLALARFTAR